MCTHNMHMDVLIWASDHAYVRWVCVYVCASARMQAREDIHGFLVIFIKVLSNKPNCLTAYSQYAYMQQTHTHQCIFVMRMYQNPVTDSTSTNKITRVTVTQGNGHSSCFTLSDRYLEWPLPWMTVTLNDRYLEWPLPWMTVTLNDRYLEWPLPLTGTRGHKSWHVASPPVTLHHGRRDVLLLALPLGLPRCDRTPRGEPSDVAA